LHRLKLADRLPKLLSLLRVFRSRFERTLRHPQRQRRDRNPSPIQDFQAAGEAFAFRPEQIFLRHAAIVENYFRGVARAHPQLVFFLPGRNPGVPFSRMNALIPCEPFDLSVSAMATQ